MDGVAKSFYKAAWIGKLPMCAICGGAGEGRRERHHLTRGVSVWLCAAHRSEWFQRRRGGRDFVASLDAVWQAGGHVTRRQVGALKDHLKRVRRPATQRDLPGSYAWPRLRQEAERRFAAGEDPARVIADLGARFDGLPVSPPTGRTLRRWFTDGRWLTAEPVARSSRSTGAVAGRTAERVMRRDTPIDRPGVRGVVRPQRE